MKRLIIVLAILLISLNAYAEPYGKKTRIKSVSDWFIFSQDGLNVSLISQDVSTGGLPTTFDNPTTTDLAGNFYYCIAKGNPHGALWIIRKVNKMTGDSDEVCRLNLKKYKYGTIRSIEFTDDRTLLVWLTLRTSGSGKWVEALVGIVGFN